MRLLFDECVDERFRLLFPDHDCQTARFARLAGLKNGQLDASWDCLRRVGNLSSASVLVVLEDVMKNRRPAPGTLGVLAAMGPGFCSELVALEW